MESRLVKLKSDFNNVITIRNSVKNIFDILQGTIDKLKFFYSEFVKNNKTEMFVFGLDSFNFQSKMIDIEYDDMKRLFLAINNRMYCEYFKLNKIIAEYILNNITEKKILDVAKINNFPVYKDLEPYKEYKFEYILEIHENILNTLSVLMSFLNNKENELSIHMTKKNIGLNIDNFITSFNFNIIVMREKIIMFIAHIEFFHKLHTKYLKRFSNKIQLMYTNISNDIKFDESVEINRNKRNELIKELNGENIDVDLLKDIKKSIGSETNSEDDDEDDDNEYKKNKNEPVDINSTSSLNSVLSLESIKNRIKSGNLIRTPSPSPKILSDNMTNLKDSLKNKVSGILQLCKPNLDKVINTNISQDDIEDMFHNINSSCELIINNEETELTFENVEKIEQKNNVKFEMNSEEIKEEQIEQPIEQLIEQLIEELIEEPIVEKIEEQIVEKIVEPIVEKIVEPIVEPIEESIVEPKKDKKKNKKKKK